MKVNPGDFLVQKLTSQASQKATLLKLAGTSAVLELGGKQVQARLEGSTSGLNIGQELRGILSKSGDGLSFKMLAGGSQGSSSTKGLPSSSQDLASLLSQNKIADTGLNRTTAKVLLQKGMPLQEGIFKLVQNFSHLFPGQDHASVEAFLYLVGANLPVSPATNKLAQKKNDYLDGLSKILKSSGLKLPFLGGFFPELDEEGMDLKKFFQKSGFNNESFLLDDDYVEEDFLTELKKQGKEALARQIKEFYSLLKLRNSSPDSKEQVLQIPYMVDGELKDLHLRAGEKEESESGVTRRVNYLDLYLELQGLGQIHLGFARTGENLRVSFVSPDPEVVEFLQSEAHEEVEEALLEIDGVEKVLVQFRKGSAQEPELFEEHSVLPGGVDFSV